MYEKVVKGKVWINAMNDEMNAINKNKTWKLFATSQR